MLRSNFAQSGNTLQFSSIASSSKALLRTPLSMPKKTRSGQKSPKAEILSDFAKLLSNDNIRTFGPLIGAVGTILATANNQNTQTNKRISHLEESIKEILNHKFKEIHSRFGDFENKVDDRFNDFEKKVDDRFNKVDERFNDFEKKVDDRFNEFEKKVYDRFNKVDDRFGELEKKFEGKLSKSEEKFENRLNKIDDKLGKIDEKVYESYRDLINKVFSLTTMQLPLKD